MASFLELFALRRKSKNRLNIYRDLINDIEHQNPVSRFLSNNCQPLFEFWRFASTKGTWANTINRIGVSFLLCHFVGILFYFTLTLKYVVNPQSAGTYIGLVVQTTLVAILLLPFLRIIILLAIPSLITGRLRAVLLVIIVSWALQIPATNIVNNIRNTVEGVACIQERIKQNSQEMRQLSRDKLQMMTQEKFGKFVDTAYKPFLQMRDSLRQLEDTVNRMIASQREMIKNIQALFKSCDEFMRLPYYRCHSIVADMYYKCMDITFDALCLTIRMLNGVCRSTRVLTLHCEWPKALKKQLEENVGTYVKEALHRTIEEAKDTTFYQFYAETRDTVNQTADSAKSVQMNITYKHEADTEFDLNLKLIKKKLRDEISAFETFLSVVITILDLMIYPIFASPFISAIIYTVRFNHGEEVDNYFVDSSFEQVDTKRQINGKESLLPLLPAEKQKYIATTTMSITARERRWLMLSIVMTLLSGIIPMLLAFTDILCYHITVKSYDFFHSNLTRIDPPNMYQLKVSGDGFMKELFSNLLDVFVPFSSGRRSEVWRDCFAEPTPPDYVLFQLMFLIFSFALLLCFIQTYVKRTRHLIALNYFPSRARPRAIHLYNLVLNNRQTVLDQFMDRRRRQEHTQPQNVEVDLDDDTQTCIRCSVGDLTLKNGSNTRVCIHCNSFYCVDCYSIRKACIHCNTSLQKLEDNLELYMDSSGSDFEEE